MVVTSKGNSKAVTNDDLLNVLESFTSQTIVFLTVVMFIVVTLLAFVATYEKTRKMPPKLKKLLFPWLSKAWNFALIVIDQEGMITKVWKINVAWLACCFAIFVLVFGYLLNLIQTDGVVMQPPRRVEVVHDLTNEPQFKDTHVMIISAFNFYQYLLGSSKETVGGNLFERMKRTDSDGSTENLRHTSFLDLQLANPANSMELFAFMTSDLAAGNLISKALLVDISMYELVVYPAACVVAPHVISRDHRSKDFVIADYVTFFFSNNVDEPLRKLASSKLTSIFEHGWIGKFYGSLVNVLESSIATDDQFTRARCLHNIPDEIPTAMFPAFGLKKLAKTFVVCSIFLALAILAFAVENIMFST
ncbi:hypothetical protein HDE_11470 [Halotydeus destructor]|nr:hypothetical protein HDE_11470 [Halotydeus destructor]